jgi:hypothetical protein
MIISNVKYTGKSTLTKMTRLISSLQNKRLKNSDKLYVHKVKLEYFNRTTNELINKSLFCNFTNNSSVDNYEKMVINSYRVSDNYNIDKDNKDVIITSRSNQYIVKATITLLEIR